MKAATPATNIQKNGILAPVNGITNGTAAGHAANSFLCEFQPFRFEADSDGFGGAL